MRFGIGTVGNRLHSARTETPVLTSEDPSLDHLFPLDRERSLACGNLS